MRSELLEAKKELDSQISRIDAELSTIDSQMVKSLASVDEPTMIVDRVFELSNSLRNAKNENDYFEADVDLSNTLKSLRERLSEEKANVLKHIQNRINDGLRRIVSTVFGPERKSPAIQLRENSYSYEVFEDTGTGTAYVNMIVLDLTIFKTTILPFIAHDSLLFKNIENDSVANVFTEYSGTEKQSFVAIDEICKYGKETAELLHTHSVIKLSNENVSRVLQL